MSIFFNLVAFAGCSAILEVFRRKGLLDKSEARADFSKEAAGQAFPFARTNAQAWVGLWLTFIASCFAIAAGMLGIFSPHTVAIASTISQRSMTMHDIIIWLSLLGGFSTIGTLGFRFRKEISSGYHKTRKFVLKVFKFLGLEPSQKGKGNHVGPVDEYINQLQEVRGITNQVASLSRDNLNSITQINADLYKNYSKEEGDKRIGQLEEIKFGFDAAAKDFLGQIESVIVSYVGSNYKPPTRVVQSNASVVAPEVRETKKAPTKLTWAQGFNTIANWFTGGEGIQLNTESRMYDTYAKYYAVRHNSLSDSSTIKNTATWIEWDLQRFTARDFPSFLIIEGPALEELIRSLKLVPGRDFAVFPVNDADIAEETFTNGGARVVRLSDINAMKGSVGSAAPLPNLDFRNIELAGSSSY